MGKYCESKIQPFKNVVYKNPGPNPMRTLPPKVPAPGTDFVEGLIPYADNDHIIHYQYSINKSMSDQNRVLHNCDGEMLV